MVLLVLAWVSGLLVATAPPSAAADLRQFQPGNIIADGVFFNPYTMTEAEIQTFLNVRGGPCTAGFTCLKSYSDTMPAKPADAFCGGYPASGAEPASRILFRVANSCGINPQVLLVMLQKEQGLVTGRSPSATAYRSAMGFGCPDTAACDTAYYGFANQVYNAARQFQRYANSGQYTWVKVGATNQIRYHPNAACGTGPVYIANKATAGLYYYTPYQPNQASLNAGYGTGDGCSSYGNRNFYQFFTDWFGSTQNPASLVQVPGRPEVWLAVGTVKHHVPDEGELKVFAAKLGWVRPAPASYVDSLVLGSPARRYVHDPRTGTLYLLQADGTKHRFPDTATIASYGYEFGSYTNIDAAQSDAFTTGPDVGGFYRVESGPEVYLLADGRRRYVTTPGAYNDAAAGRNSYISSMSAAGAAKIPAGPALLPRHSLVRETSGASVYLTLADGSLLHIPSFGLAADAGRREYVVVANGTLANSTVRTGSLSPFIRCGSAVYLVAGGTLRPVTGSATGGLTPLDLPEAACADMPKSASSVSAPFLVQVPGRAEAYVLEAGQLHHVRSYDRLMQITGGAAPRFVSWSADTANGVGVGAPELAAGTYVQFVGEGEVYRGDGRGIRHVTSYDALVRSNGGRVPPIEKLPVAQKAYYTVGTPIS
ncbi:hypothetical protein GCM10009710_00130 [Aeromicrobium alkaliterrae]|uniref:Hemagglutinin-related protein n=2 Tax=Aeromicrobium alkaliterrae TaxID=302168 RepID=A0ABN2JE72_9ACTN